MPPLNADLAWRPLYPGIRIINPKANTPGTIGFFGEDHGGQRWLVSCGHVLIRPPGAGGEPFQSGEPIFQPDLAGGQVATMVGGKANATLDVAAALLDGTVQSGDAIPGVGSPARPIPPRVGMPVVKRGAATGVTEGVVTKVFKSTVQIAPPSSFPQDYGLTSAGDSGALWLERDSLAAIALHRSGNQPGRKEFSIAVLVDVVLRTLDLRLPAT